MDKEMKLLVKENLKIRNELALLIGNLKSKEQTKTYNLIWALIDNEVKQEKYCNQ